MKLRSATAETAVGRDAALLSVAGVGKRFRTPRHDTSALQQASFAVSEGEFICLAGC